MLVIKIACNFCLVFLLVPNVFPSPTSPHPPSSPFPPTRKFGCVKKLKTITMKPLQSGHHWDFKLVSVIESIFEDFFILLKKPTLGC